MPALRPAVAALAAAGAVGYLLGTIPTADLVAHRATGGTVDLRSVGSGNPGAANTAAQIGVAAGLAVFVGDAGKGVAATAIGAAVAGPLGAHVAATSAVVGHCYPVWNGFRGGKGVATSVGQCFATFPAYFPIDAGIALATVSSRRWKQQAFAATMVSSACWVLGALVWWRRGWPNLWGPRPTAALPLAAATSTVVMAQRFLAARTSS